jgi:dolichol-phosphate mannosyltransferase
MDKKISIIIPCHNEEDNIRSLLNEVSKCTSHLKYEFEFIFVDDGSTDGTYRTVLKLMDKRNDIKIIKLSRNFGKEPAMAAGLKYCNCDAAIIMDSDLQHPPHLIPALISEWEKGVNIVDAVKTIRQKENILKRILSLAFNRVISILTATNFQGSSDFKLLDRTVIDILNNIDEKNRFFRGLTNWIGLTHSIIQFEVEDRKYGTTKWNWFKLARLFFDAITSYSSIPLQIVTVLGFFTLIFSIILGVQTLYNKYFGNAISGFTTVILVLLILCSLIMISIGIIGIYLAKIYNEVKNRPIYIVDSVSTVEKETDT